MPTFEIYLFCDLCVDVHRTARSVELEGVAPRVHRLTEIFPHGSFPPDIAAFIDTGFECPTTRKRIAPIMPRHVFLAPAHP